MPKTVEAKTAVTALLARVRDPQACGVALDDDLLRLLYPFAERKDFAILGHSESVDAALTLISRQLPDWRMERLMQNIAGRWYACLEHRHRRAHLLNISVASEAPTAARALIAAFLKALDEGD